MESSQPLLSANSDEITSCSISSPTLNHDDTDARNDRHQKKHNIYRASTAPTLPYINKDSLTKQSADVVIKSSNVFQPLLYLVVYLCTGIILYSIFEDQFESKKTNLFVDALYYSVLTMNTIGFGDINPITPEGKIAWIAFLVTAFGFLNILINETMSAVLDFQENLLIRMVTTNGVLFPSTKRCSGPLNAVARCFINVEKRRVRIRVKVGIAIVAVIMCTGIGMVFLHVVEKNDWVNSFMKAVLTVTTVGYGGHVFNTLGGRIFASIWILLSTQAVLHAFLYMVELRIEKRNKKVADLVIAREMTLSQFLEADIDHDGCVRSLINETLTR